MGSLTFAVHDLVRIDPSEIAISHFEGAPAWLAPSLRRAPWLVVRRRTTRGALFVGVRGRNRSQRFAGRISTNDVLERLAPEELCLPAVRSEGRLGDAARLVSAHAATLGLAWGPVGSFGFELASGHRTTTDASDLDIVVRAAGVPRTTLVAFDGVRTIVSDASGVRLDVELAFTIGRVALAEYATAPTYVVAKTPRGPQLVPCP